MAHRNRLFRTLNKNLRNEGLKAHEARQLAKDAVSNFRRNGIPGGHYPLVPNITYTFYSCHDDAILECDSSNKYRDIEGFCNNLEHTGFEGSAGFAGASEGCGSDAGASSDG